MSNNYSPLHRLAISPAGIAWVYLMIVLVYAYQAILPGLNGDDVVQIQSISLDARSFVGQGRWGYYMVFQWLQDNNPGGLFYSAVGSALLLLSSWFAVRLFDFRHAAAIYAFLLVSCISIYYGMLFDFDSTRLAYPLANVFALGGVYAWFKGRYVAGLLLMAVAPSLYPAASQVAGMLLLCLALLGCLRGHWVNALKQFASGTAGLVGALVLYFVVTHFAYRYIGITTSGRMSVSPFAVIENFDIIKALFLNHSIAFITQQSDSVYITPRWTLPLLGIFVMFSICYLWACFQRRSLAVGLVTLALIVVSLFAAFSLAFAGSNTPFPPRSLIALALLHGFWVAFTVEQLCSYSLPRRASQVVSWAAVAIAGAFLFDTGSQINKFAYDDYLATRVDLLATNRIVQRIENRSASEGFTLGYPQTLAVIYDLPLPAGPRGDVGTARYAPWSREWIFRLVDTRFLPPSAAQYEAARSAAAGRAGWPAEESVFFHEGMVVVVINQQETSE